jgi:hypothetical protein
MKTTSRRNFARTMTAALAAAPVALLTKTGARAQTPSKGAEVRPSREQIRFHQDTPPPIEILDGSLIVESADEFDETGSYLYTLKIDPVIEHIRVIADNGDKIYEDLDASEVTTGGDVTSSIIDIVVVNEDNVRSNVNITGGVKIGADRFFQIKSDKRLKKDNQKKRRKFKYDHEGNGGNKRVRIESIEITNVHGRKTKFTASPTRTGDDFIPDEFRILIWR